MPMFDKAACRLLDEIGATFGLCEADLAELFQVRRRSLASWRKRGIPQSRRATAERLSGLATVFRREIIASRIPEIVRTKDDWLGGRTILQTIKTDGAESVYGYLQRVFSGDR
jgi:hypothetical protein